MRSNPDTYKASDAQEKKKTNTKREYPAYRRLYEKFLYFRHFVSPSAPLIMCEGKTDNIYLRSALKGLHLAYPRLAEVKDDKLFAKIAFLKHSRVEHDILELSGGSGNIANFVAHYKGAVYKYKCRPMENPIIILLDNDSGGNAVFKQANDIFKTNIGLNSGDNFYHLCHNLYLIKTPEYGATGESCMENLFDDTMLRQVVDGKKFSLSNENDTATHYGKLVFSDTVVRANYASINFDSFKVVFDRIGTVIIYYAMNKFITCKNEQIFGRIIDLLQNACGTINRQHPQTW